MPGGALIRSSVPADGTARMPLPWALDRQGQGPALTLRPVLLTGSGRDPGGSLGSGWGSVCVSPSGLCCPGKADRALGLLHSCPEVLNQAGGHVWSVVVTLDSLAENSYLLLRK